MQELNNLTSALAQRTQLATSGSSSQKLQLSNGGADHLQPEQKEAQQQLQAMSSVAGVHPSSLPAHSAFKPTAFAFDPDSAMVYAVVNLDTDERDAAASEPAIFQSAQSQPAGSTSSMVPEESKATADVKGAKSQVPVFVAVSATSLPASGKKNTSKPSAGADSEATHLQEEETKSGQSSAGGAIDPAVSANEIEVQFKDEIQEFASLAQLSSHSSHHVLYANERCVGESRYKLPESSVTHKGKIINFVDTYNQPQCMRFCPSLSSNDVQISHSGLTAKCISTKDASGNDKTTFVVANMTFTEGAHYWEIICPISINNIHVGIQSVGNPATVITQDFVSSTRRTIGVYLNLNERALSFWINGKNNKKTKNKTIQTPGLAWRPYIRFMEENYVAILKPFCRLPQSIQFSHHKAKQATILPESLTTDSHYVQVSYIADLIRNFLLVWSANKGIETTVKTIAQPDASFKILVPSQAELSQAANGFVALLKFDSVLETNLFAQNLQQNLKDVILLDAWNIAKLVHSRYVTTPNYVLGFDRFKTQQLQQIRAVFSKFLIDELFTPDHWKTLSMIGVQVEKPHALALKQALEGVRLRVKHQKNVEQGSPSLLNKPANVSGPSEIAYLKKSQSILVTHGPELKVFMKENSSNHVKITNFSNYAQFPEDKVGLKISVTDLDFLIEHMNWDPFEQSDSVISFFNSITHSYASEYFVLPYVSALMGVAKILETLKDYFIQFEGFSSSVNLKDIQADKKIVKNPKIEGTTSYRQLSKLLRIVIDLEDQLWAMAQSDSVSERVKRLWPLQEARLHSTYGRVSSFINFSDSENPVNLAELGLINYADNEKKLCHFMDPFVPIESIYEDHGSSPFEIALEKQLTENYMLKGYDTFNVPLAKTINSLPPSLHQNFATAIVPEFANIELARQLSTSAVVLTGSKTCGSINLWSTQLGLNLLGGFNFLNDYLRIQAGQTVTLKLTQFTGNYEENNVKLLLRNHKASNQSAKAQEPKKEAAAVVFDDENDDLSGFALFQAQVDQIEEKEVVLEKDITKLLSDLQKESDEYYSIAKVSVKDAEILSLLDFQKTWQSLPIVIQDKVPSTNNASQYEEIKVTKLPTVKETKKPDKEEEKKKKLEAELKQMGFELEDINKAYNKAANKDIDSILDILSEEQEKKKLTQPQKVVEKIEYNSYTCLVCTLINSENPGPECSVCGSPAPQTAIKVDPELEKKKAFEALKLKEMAEENARIEEIKEKERKERIAKEELEARLKLEKAQAQVKMYFEKSDIVDYFFASINSGKNVTPFVSSAALYNKETHCLHFHFVRFFYKQDYIYNFVSNAQDFATVLASKQTAVESLYPLFIADSLQKDYNLQFSRQQHPILGASLFGVASLKLKEVSNIIQIGENITETSPIFLVAIGKEDDGHRVVVIKIDFNFEVTVIENCAGSQSIIEPLREFDSTDPIVKVVCAQASEHVDNMPRILVQTQNNKLVCFKVSFEKGENGKDFCRVIQKSELALGAGEGVAAVSNGIVCLRSGVAVRTVSIDSFLHDRLTKQNTGNELVAETKPIGLINEEQVLNLQITPKKVTIADIDAYENLMSGAIVPASSNASFKSGAVGEPYQNLYAKHTWLAESTEAQSEIGPIEVKFDRPISLVSLNIDVSFETHNSEEFFKKVSSDNQVKEEKKETSQIVTTIDQGKKEGVVNEAKMQAASQQLGPFMIKNAVEKDQKSVVTNNKKTLDSYIPIVVKRNKGASFNCQNIPNRLVVDNDKMFGSNYAKPEITFTHIDNERIYVEKISIKTPTTSKTGAYPMGEGLIFLADTQEHFENTEMFRSFSLSDYQNWRKARLQDPRPLRPNEPVAFFQFDDKIQITFELDEQRPARYIMLKPTGFRQKPNKLSQNAELVPMEIQFFGVMGRSQKMSQALECVQIHDPCQNILQPIHSDYSCEVYLLDTHEKVAHVQNFKIDQLKIMNMSLSPKTLTDASSAIQKTCEIEGLSLIKITDSSILLRKVAGFSIVLKSKSGQSQWKLTSASVQGLYTKVSSDTAAKSESLFGQDEIPSCYYRSCLLTPRFFPVINKQIALIASDPSYNRRLRIRVMNFFKNIMRIETELTPLVFGQIELEKFLQTNIIGQDSSTVTAACEFLQSFQQEPEFATSLYEILIRIFQSLPDKQMPQKGYHALIGMLKWALPLDFKRTLKVLIDGFYTKVIMQKIKKAQTPHSIRYRTKIAPTMTLPNCYPFDSQTFEKSEGEEKKNEGSQVEKKQQTQQTDLISCVQISQTRSPDGKFDKKKELKVVTNAKFFEKVKLSAIKVFMGSDKTTQFLMDITITDGPTIVFFKSYPLHVYNQLVEYADGMYGDTKYAHALTIPRVNYEGSNLKIEVHFNPMNAKGDTILQLPEVAYEFYGTIDENLFDVAVVKHKQTLEQRASMMKQAKSVQGSIQYNIYASTNDPTTSIWIPKETVEKAEEEKPTAIEPLFAEEESTEGQPSQPTSTEPATQQSDQSPLVVIQRDLEALVMIEDAGQLAVKTCVINISQLQASAQAQAEKANSPLNPEKSLAYFMNLATDFSKLIRHIYTKMSSQQAAKDTIRQFFAAVDATGQGSLANVSIDMFTHFIAYDSGIAQKQMQIFLKDVLLQLLTPEEKSTFINTIIDRFLAVPNDMISQKSIVQALLNIEVSANELMLYLQKGLCLNTSDEDQASSQLKENPITMMYAIMYMTEKLFCQLQLDNGFKVTPLVAHKKSEANAKSSNDKKPGKATKFVEDYAEDATEPTEMSSKTQKLDAKAFKEDDEQRDTSVLDYDTVFDIFIQISIFVCKNEQKFFSRDEQVSLLMLACQNIKLLGRVVSMNVISKFQQKPKSAELMLVTAMLLNENELLNMNYLEKIYLRVKTQKVLCRKMINPNKEQLDDLCDFLRDIKALHTFHSMHADILLNLLTGLINIELGQPNPDANSVTGPLFHICQHDKVLWLQYTSYCIDEYITKVGEIEEMQKILDEKPQLNKEDEEKFNSFNTTKRSSEGSLRIFKSLISILQSKNKPHEISSFDDAPAVISTQSEQNPSQIWSLTLKTLRTVELSALVQANLLEQLIHAFLLSSETIKQTTYMEILKISKLIADQNKHGAFICKLLFTTIPHIDSNLKDDSVVYAICQGWLDTLILSGCTGELGPFNGDKSKGIVHSLAAEDVGGMLNYVSKFLTAQLNIGSFEGVAGSNQLVIVQLSIALDMLRVAFLAKDGENKAIQKLFNDCEKSEELRKQLKESMDNLLLWLVLNGREAADETYLSVLGNQSLQTPATTAVKQITTLIKDILMLVADCVQNLESIKIALSSLVLIVSNVNKGLAKKSKEETIGFDTAIALSNKTNALFSKLLQSWLVSEKAVNFFVFELKGFEFLLDTISCDKSEPTQTDAVPIKSDVKAAEQPAATPRIKSDLFSLVKQWQEKKDTDKDAAKDSEAASVISTIKTLVEDAKSPQQEDNFKVPLAEYANKITLLKTSTNDSVAAYAHTDWPANKRAYKHKMYSNPNAKNHLEFTMLFELPFVILLREIQIGCINYWQTESEVYVEPLSVVVEAGLTKDNMQHVLTLDIVKDPAFASVGSQVYGKTIMGFRNNSADKCALDQLIEKSLGQLMNFKAKFIQFRMRRGAFACMENSLLSNKHGKPHYLAVHYISLTGYDCSKTVGNYHRVILHEQKKTATEVMSQICSGDFSQSLKVIANQPETINKIKEHFTNLVQLVEIKAGIIEPIFISIASHNTDMGDWIINKFINNKLFQHSALIGKLVLCDPSQIVNRIRIMLDMTVDTLTTAAKTQGMLTQTLLSFMPFVKVFIKTFHMAAHMLNNQVDLAISTEVITSLIGLMNLISSNENSEDQLLTTTELIILLIKPPMPFANSKVNTFNFICELLEGCTQQNQFAVKSIAGIIASQNAKLALHIFERMKDEFDKCINLIKHGYSITGDQLKPFQADIQLLYNLSRDSKVCARLQANEMPLIIYESMKEADPIKAKRLIKNLDSKVLFILTELVLQLTTGCASLEAALAKQIIADLDVLCKQQDEVFIKNLMLPFFQIEKTLPVSLTQKRSNPSLLGPISEAVIVLPSSTSFIPSAMLDETMLADLATAFKKVGGEKYTTLGKWVKVFESNELYLDNQQFDALIKAIQDKGEMLLLLSGEEQSEKTKLTFGSFITNALPSNPNMDNNSYSGSSNGYDYEIKQNETDVLFVNVDGVGMHCFQMGDIHHPSGAYIPQENTLYTGIISTLVYNELAYDNYICGVSSDEKKHIDIGKTHDSPLAFKEYEKNNFTVQKREIWLFNAAGVNGPTAVKSTNEIKPQKIQEEVLTKFNNHQWINKLTPFNLFRSRPVFMVPSHIQVKTLAKILLKQGVALSTAAVTDGDLGEMTLEDVYARFMDSMVRSEQANNILDFEYDSESLQATQPVDANFTAHYQPKHTFFDFFQENGGVGKLFAVAIQCTSSWTNQQLKEGFQLWLGELESFTKIPLYFNYFLENKQSQELLFSVLVQKDIQTLNAANLQTELKEAVQQNYKILQSVFAASSSVAVRESAIEHGFITRILERLSAISGEKARKWEEVKEDKTDEVLGAEPQLEKKESAQYDPNVTQKARKGVGYSAKQGEIFNVNQYLENKKQRNEQIVILVDIITNLFATDEWEASSELVKQMLESALLPILESAFRNGSFLDMAKEANVYHSYCALTRAIAGQEKLAPCLVEIDKNYKPTQVDPVYKLLGKLNELATIFLNCLTETLNVEKQEDESEKLAKDVKETYEIVMDTLDDYFSSQQNENLIADALQLPVAQQYVALLAGLRFDYMDMKVGADYKHHYKSSISSNQTMPQTKMIRLAQELADLSNALPCQHTDAVYVRVDKSRVDMMKALICGAADTPYAHGVYEFDLFMENNYPNGPPKMNLMTTGAAAIRFNPNLYHCGKVCLSLLGTWRGQATENWDPKLSTILQLLLSTQAIIMSNEVYFNEPGFENEAGTKDGERKNEGYANIVRYGNVKWAMLGQLKNPSKGFETVIKRHFYVKKAEILKDLHKWIDRAGKVEALYTGLTHDHNSNIAKDFQKSKTRYKEALEKEVMEFEEALNKMDKPTNYLPPVNKREQRKKKDKKKDQAITEGQVSIDDVDVADDSVQIDTSSKPKDINVEDDAVKDRWSRYIGAMGVEAVAKQAAANIFVSGAGALGVEISKNLVLSGCKSFTLHDTQPITQRDLSGQFFLNLAEGKSRSEICLPRLQQLNFYVRCKLAPSVPIPLDSAEYEKEPWNFQNIDVFVLTEADYATAIAVDTYCRAKGKKFIYADLKGVFGRLFNDYGDNFEVLDKNGEELQDCMIKSITNAEQGVVTLLDNNKHNLEDGDEVMFVNVEGMKLKAGEKQLDPAFKSDSINETIHKVQVLTRFSFKIGNTQHFEAYERNGIVKPMRMKRTINFKSFEDVLKKGIANFKEDDNLMFSFAEKMGQNIISHIAFEALDTFKVQNKGAMPRPWNLEDCTKFLEIAKEVAKPYDQKPEEWKADGIELKLLHLFCFQAQGVFNPMAAFFGGFIAQEVVKAITQKFTPAIQAFYYDASEVLPDLKPEQHCVNAEAFESFLKSVNTNEINHRSDGLRIVLGAEMVDKLAHSKVFMVGAGAIGCELLKNYAMLGVGTGKAEVNQADKTKSKSAGSIVLTDPDIIEVSNLNRQFLFREKHLRKPKSQTAAAAAIYMNPELKGNVVARLDKVHEGTSHIFTNKFFEDLTLVTNALDNVQARKYVDLRCVSAKTPLLESGTLGPKGHVQVILPYKTESYGQMNDPEDNNEVPYCTLKMFPQETLHCVEWARDKFQKLFTQYPQSALKILDDGEKIGTVSAQDIQALKEGLKLLKKRPNNFMDCVEFARNKFEKLFNHAMKQLIYTYPLDKKNEDGNLFWSLPKRPPRPVDFDKDNMLHCSFICALACLRANIFHVEIPHKNPRSDEFKKLVGNQASAFKPPEFVPNDEKAKEIEDSVKKEASKKEAQQEEEKKEEETKEEETVQDLDDVEKLKEEFLNNYEMLKKVKQGKTFEQALVKPEDFEKDNDANFHIDFIYSSGNIRASCYKLDPMDWITVKLKAGRIVPALATTTAAIAGLQALELVKVVKGVKKDSYRNVFLNLAVPMMQATEPGDIIKSKLMEGLEVSIWDRWDVKNAKQMTLEGLIAHVEETYKGLEVRDVMLGSQPIYFHAIMNAPGKENDKKKALNTSIRKLTECDSDDLYVDLAITCVRKGDEQAKIIAGVPPVRVFF